MPLSYEESLSLLGIPFRELPPRGLVDVLGVTYMHLRSESGDDLYLTERGWSWLKELLPSNWYREGNYQSFGQRLRFSTGTVHRLSIAAPRRLQIVVKVSRVGQHLESSRLRTQPNDLELDQPGFLSPFEEISGLELLRRHRGQPRILTKRPLAVFSPKTQYRDWELGRDRHQFSRHARNVTSGQREIDPLRRVTLDPRRDYLVIFQWMRGLNLEECVERGILDHREADAINQTVVSDLNAKGFDVLDHKPNHVIVSVRPDGSLLRRRGRVVYGLADFELLVQLKGEAGKPAASK